MKLLRVLQEREFERLGGTETVKVNVRLIAATNKDMEKAIAAGTFREDLYYRLNVFTIFVPPLRERKADLLLLADHFLEKFSREHGKSIKRISTPAIDMLMSYHWPGNVRELENTLERAVLVCDGHVIHAHHLPPTLQTAEASGTVTRVSLSDAVAAYEKDLISDALKTTRGNRAKAARLLDTTERILNYKVRKYTIDYRRFKSRSRSLVRFGGSSSSYGCTARLKSRLPLVRSQSSNQTEPHEPHELPAEIRLVVLLRHQLERNPDEAVDLLRRATASAPRRARHAPGRGRPGTR